MYSNLAGFKRQTGLDLQMPWYIRVMRNQELLANTSGFQRNRLALKEQIQTRQTRDPGARTPPAQTALPQGQNGRGSDSKAPA